VTWAEDIEQVQTSAAGLLFLGLALVTAAPEVSELIPLAGEATRESGLAVIELSRSMHGLWHDLTDAAAAHNNRNERIREWRKNYPQ
jgi:hypothetical protein